MQLQTGHWVLVCDAGKALLLQNHGDSERLDLRVIDKLELTNPPTGEQGSDAPGRFSSPAGHLAAGEPTDFHDQAEDAFARTVAERTRDAMHKSGADGLVVVADPRTLGRLRKSLLDSGTPDILAEIAKDYAHREVPDIEALIAIH